MPEQVNLGHAVRLTPEAAVEYFRSKGFAISDNWWEVWERAHARAFTVARAAKLSVLRDIRNAVDEALATGMTEREFIKQLEPVLRKRGWWGKRKLADGRTVQLGSHRRLKTIYRVNTRTAYQVGRWRSALGNKAHRPFLQYVAVMDSRTRESHAALNGVVFAIDDVFWKTHMPPNGWNCRCTVRALTAHQVKARGLKVRKGAGRMQRVAQEAGVDKLSGEVVMRPGTRYSGPDKFGKHVELLPDAGWSYNPGEALPPGALPSGPLSPVSGQRGWRDYGLKKLAATKPPALLPKHRRAADAFDSARSALPPTATTPLGPAEITDDFVEALIAGGGHHEQHALWALQTLRAPREIWLAEMADAAGRRMFHEKHIGIYRQRGRDVPLVITRDEQGEFVDFQFGGRGLDAARAGALLWPRKQ